MKVWIFQTGEPLHIDNGCPRPMRAMNLANSLLKAGHQVVLWSSGFYHQEKLQRCDHYTIFQVSDGFEIRLIPSVGYKRNIGVYRLIDHAQLAFRLKKILKVETEFPDVVFVGYPPIETASILVSWCKNKNLPALLDVKDLWPSMFLDVIPKVLRPVAKLVFSPYFCLAKKSMQNATGLSAMTDAFLKWTLDQSGREKNQFDGVFPLTSPPSQLSESELVSARGWWKDLGVIDDGKTVRMFFVGSFMSIYDFDPIRESAYLAQKHGISIQFVLCGDGGSFDQIRSMMEGLSNVVFSGWVDRPKIECLANMSHAALAPYLNIDNFKINTTNKIIDALSLGLPIISPLQGEVANLMLKYNIGLRYGTDTGKTLYDCICTLMNDQKLQQELSKNGKKLYVEQFSFDNVYGSLVLHLEEMADIGCDRSNAKA